MNDRERMIDRLTQPDLDDCPCYASAEDVRHRAERVAGALEAAGFVRRATLIDELRERLDAIPQTEPGSIIPRPLGRVWDDVLAVLERATRRHLEHDDD